MRESIWQSNKICMEKSNMRKIFVVLSAMVVAVFVASSAVAGEHEGKGGPHAKGTVKVDGEKVLLVKADGSSVEITGDQAASAKELNGKDVMVVGEEKDGKIAAKKVTAKEGKKKGGCGGCAKDKKADDK